MSAPLWPAGVGREVHDALDSTNAEGLRRLRAGLDAPLWIRARAQTAGRGRRGRAWRAGDPDLTASLAFRPGALRRGVTPGAIATLSFAAGLAIADTVEALAPGGPRAQLKWPNDVLVGEAKIAGVLLESEGGGLVIGVGLNLGRPPEPETLEPGALAPTSIAALTGAPADPDHALTLLAAAMDRWIAEWAAEGFDGLRNPWLDRAARLGLPMIARLPAETVAGRFTDVDADGALVLETALGFRRIAAADVYWPAPGETVSPPPAGRGAPAE